jgi:hypothetical protein
MRYLYEWLGVDTAAVATLGFDVPENVTPEILRMSNWGGVFHRLRHSQYFRVLMPHLPQLLRRSAAQLATKQVERRSINTSEVTAFLRTIQQPQTRALARILGRDFPEWVVLENGEAREPSSSSSPRPVSLSVNNED